VDVELGHAVVDVLARISAKRAAFLSAKATDKRRLATGPDLSLSSHAWASGRIVSSTSSRIAFWSLRCESEK
jgi:hypothetical protein